MRPFRVVPLRRVRAPGDRESSFELLYEQSFDRVAAYVLARADADLAADAVARTFEVAWRRWAELPDDPIPWLLVVARNVLSELRRARGRRDNLIERIALTAPRDDGSDPADAAVEREVARAALAELGATDREVLLLVAWDGLTERQAAEVAGCTPGAFAVRLSRARARLRSAIDAQQPCMPMMEERP